MASLLLRKVLAPCSPAPGRATRTPPHRPPRGVFREVCDGVVKAKVEFVVRKEEPGETVAAAVGQLQTSKLVVGLHDKSFLYGSPSPYAGVSGLGCRVLAVRQHATARHRAVGAELTLVETMQRHILPPKITVPIFTLLLGVIWRRSSSKRRK